MDINESVVPIYIYYIHLKSTALLRLLQKSCVNIKAVLRIETPHTNLLYLCVRIMAQT